MLIAVKIHNHSLGKVTEVSSEEEGKSLIKDWVAEQFGRELTAEEEETLENELEFYDDSDPDNHYTFSVGAVD